ncbi:MAG: MoaD/ThiS family protein [Candidatus Sumerlaeaceae bacterium]
MPTVSVNYYHRLRELSGFQSERMHLDAGATVTDLKHKVLCTHPAIQPFHDSLLIARNNEYAQGGETLCDDDVLDFMPPVSGG